jgi:hypothetical protein
VRTPIRPRTIFRRDGAGWTIESGSERFSAPH